MQSKNDLRNPHHQSLFFHQWQLLLTPSSNVLFLNLALRGGSMVTSLLSLSTRGQVICQANIYHPQNSDIYHPQIQTFPTPKKNICQEDSCHPQFFSSFFGALFLAFSTYSKEDNKDGNEEVLDEVFMEHIKQRVRDKVVMEHIKQEVLDELVILARPLSDFHFLHIIVQILKG